MPHDTQAKRLRRELLAKLAGAIFRGDLAERVDRFPLDMRPRDAGQPLRCCLHKERAVLRYRAMAMLGFSVQDETDELRPLADYAREALGRRRRAPGLLTVIEDACSACVKTSYVVSDACRGCLAQSCLLNCPKGAISIQHGRSVIDPDRCVSCGRCQGLCAFNAILRVPIPCEEACPVEAIRRGESGKQVIDEARCIACGRCMGACPFGAIAERSELVEVLSALAAGRPLVALAAPALAAQFEASLEQLVGALKRLGFTAVVEVAAGADQAAEDERRELAGRLEEGEPFMTSSCCPAYTGYVDLKLPGLKPRVSHTASPMTYAAMRASERFQGVPRVFLSPCLAKRREALDGRVEHVLTFEELGAAFMALDIEVGAMPPAPPDLAATSKGRAFAAAGGVAAAVGVEAETLAGLGPDTLRRLRQLAGGKAAARFVEVMGCEGGCVNGPCTLADPRVAKRRLG